MRASFRKAGLLFLIAAGWPAVATGQGTTRLVINADLGEHTISRHIYGHFAEHLGRGIYDGFWVRSGSGDWQLRDDVIAALRRIRIPNLRWPGGCFADYYHWRDGVGPRTERPTMVNTLWGGVTEDNSFGTHEFMELARRLGAEPFIVGNVGSGTVEEMAKWWEYLNHPGGSSLAELRARNGQREPFNVRYWGIGNESWGCGGNMTAATYAQTYRRFAEFIRPIGDIKPFRVATGPYGDGYEWMEVLMREAGSAIDGVDLHQYTLVGDWQKKGSATEFGEREWFVAMQRALRMDEMLTRQSTIMDRYDPERRVALIVGEWGMWHDPEPGSQPGFLYQQNTLRDALVAGVQLNIFNRHAARVRMANIAQTVNVLQAMVLTKGDQLILTPTYHVFDLYQAHQDATLLPVWERSERYRLQADSIPAINVSASRDRDGHITVTLVNLDPQRARTVQAEVRGQKVSGVTGRILTGGTMNAHNTFERPDAVQPAEFRNARLAGNVLRIELPARSVVALQLR